MLKTPICHPEILAALGAAGHGSKVLIADGNYPHVTRLGSNAKLVFANFMPGVISGVSALEIIASAVPIESAAVMQAATTGPYALAGEPPIWDDYRRVLRERAGHDDVLDQIERFAFYDAAGTPDVCLTLATGEQQIYANLLLTIGVVK